MASCVILALAMQGGVPGWGVGDAEANVGIWHLASGVLVDFPDRLSRSGVRRL